MSQQNAVDILDRDPALDGIRGLALAMVLVYHGLLGFKPTGPWIAALSTMTEWLYVAVDLFFVLSGFLITSILIRTRSSGGYFKNFYARRALRIFPAYYLVVGTTYLFLLSIQGTPGVQESLHDAPYFLSYTQNVLMAWRGHISIWVGLDHTWSMAVEEQFYLLWPLVVWLTPPRRLLALALVIGACSVAIKGAMVYAGLPHWTYYVASISHAEGLAVGAATAAWYAGRAPGASLPLAYRLGGGLAGLGFAMECVAHMFGRGWGHLPTILFEPLASMFFGRMIIAVLDSGPTALLRRFLSSAFTTFLGRYSYGIYLIHFPILMGIYALYLADWEARLGANPAHAGAAILTLSVTVPLALAMFHGVEKPALRLKRYFVPRRVVAPAAAGQPARGAGAP